MDLKKIGLLILITGGILSAICPGVVYAGAAYIYEMANPSDTGYAGAGFRDPAAFFAEVPDPFTRVEGEPSPGSI
jgi:hypothetical protein